jgi:hypothetical protein
MATGGIDGHVRIWSVNELLDNEVSFINIFISFSILGN